MLMKSEFVIQGGDLDMQKYKKSIPSRLTETWDNLPLRGKYFSINSGSQTS